VSGGKARVVRTNGIGACLQLLYLFIGDSFARKKREQRKIIVRDDEQATRKLSRSMYLSFFPLWCPSVLLCIYAVVNEAVVEAQKLYCKSRRKMTSDEGVGVHNTYPHQSGPIRQLFVLLEALANGHFAITKLLLTAWVRIEVNSHFCI
jgi:hypothetical protein